jgi:hypothetical protein
VRSQVTDRVTEPLADRPAARPAARPTRRFILGIWASVLVAVVSGLSGHRALAAGPHGPTIEITVIHAMSSDAGGAIDPLLRDLPQLTREQPFVRYNVYRVLERKELPLEADRPAAIGLPNGRLLQVTLVDQAAEAARRFHVRAEIGEPGKKAFLKLLEVTASGNEPFFVGGQSYEGGTLFLELVVRP